MAGLSVHVRYARFLRSPDIPAKAILTTLRTSLVRRPNDVTILPWSCNEVKDHGQVLCRQPALRAILGDRHHQSRLRRMAERLLRPQNDGGAPRPAHPSLQHRRDTQRLLALQNPRSRLTEISPVSTAVATMTEPPASAAVSACIRATAPSTSCTDKPKRGVIFGRR